VRDGPVDNGLGGFVVCETDAAAMASLSAALLGAQLAPPAAASLTTARGPSTHPARAGLGVGEVKAFLGADLASRDQQAGVANRHGERMDNSNIHAAYARRVDVVGRNRNRRGDIQP
jgi:hypothetical protein